MEPSLYESGYDKNHKETYICEECDYRTPFIANINIHKSEAHGKWQEVRRKNKPSSQTNGRREYVEPRLNKSESSQFAPQVRRENGFCRHWNRGYCPYEERCKFLHEESPECYFGDNCSRKSVCRFFHADLFRSQQFFLVEGSRTKYQSQ